MTSTEWAVALLTRHADVLSAIQVEETRAYIADGDGLLTGYGLFRDGLHDGCLTEQDLREALDLAERGMFSKLSGGVEKAARTRLGEPVTNSQAHR